MHTAPSKKNDSFCRHTGYCAACLMSPVELIRRVLTWRAGNCGDCHQSQRQQEAGPGARGSA